MLRWIGRFIRTMFTLLCGLAAVLAVFLIGVAGRVEASDGMRGNKCVVGAGEHITEDFYFFCRTLDVYGAIDGDLIGIAVEVRLWPGSAVFGDVWVGGGQLEVSGEVGDDVHFGGVAANVRSTARFGSEQSDLAAVMLDLGIDDGVEVPGDLLVYGYQIRLGGAVGGDIDFSGEALLIEGSVAGQIDVSVGDARRSNDLPSLPFWDVNFHNPGLWIGDEAQLAGDVIYRAASPSIVPVGVVEGQLEFVLSNRTLDITKAEQPNEAAQIIVDYIRRTLSDVVTLLIIGLIFLRLLPRAIRQPAVHVRQRVVSAVGWGLVTFMFSVPVAIMIVIIGLLLLLILYFVKLTGLMVLVTVFLLVAGSGLLGGFYFLLFFMGRIVISFLIGQVLHRYVLHLPEWGQLRQWIFTLALGSTVYALISNMPLPAMGLIFELVTALAGGGAVIMTIRDVLIETGLFAPAGVIVEPPVVHEPVILNVPALPAPAPVPGMENLPEGFTGFDEDW